MTVTHRREPVTGVLRDMAADADVCGELVHAARSRSPEVARLAEAETHRHVAAMIAQAGGWLATFGRIEEQDFAAALLLGGDRAGQGVPMTALLRGVQAALTRAAEIAVDRCRSAGVPDGSLLTAVLLLKEYGDAVERQVIHGYRAVELAPPPTAAEIRTRLLRRLLTGDAALTAEEAAELAKAGIHRDTPVHCLATDAADPAPVRLLTRRLSCSGGLFALVDGRLAGLSRRIPPADEIGTGTLAVVSPAVPRQELRPAHRLCVRALDIGGRRGLRGLYGLTDFAGEIALDGQPLLGAWLGDRLLGSLDRSDGFHRQLALTALTFLEHGQRLDQTAAILFTHPNTVRYRLGRLQRITGRSLTDTPAGGRPGPLDTLHWWWALTAWLRTPPTSPAVSGPPATNG
ncbi:PucR family transcriptional regulator [Streptomyces sp. NPDC088258]|uniref:PucR family transcriptional regulator n=1 Tax=Streptomyces sp. NPDC088258 TaxID=3365849 RepID=UPI00382D04C3